MAANGIAIQATKAMNLHPLVSVHLVIK